MRNTTLFLTLSIFLLALLCSCSRPVDLAPIRLEEHNREADSDVLKDALAGGSAEEKLAAAIAMGRIQSAAYVGPLTAALADPGPGVRDAAIFALGQFGIDVEMVEVLFCTLQH
jgi:HEAT repeat protein